MLKYEFNINKEASFVYWAQSLIKWGPYFERGANEYYLRRIGALNQKQEKSLSVLKSFLEKKENGFLWLWGKYTDKKDDFAESTEVLNNLRDSFADTFDLLWAKEEQGLKTWKGVLESQNFQNVSYLMGKVKHFLKSDKNPDDVFTIQLLVHWDRLPSGHANPNFNNLIILNISSVLQDELNRVIGVLAHETIHHFGYSSNFEKGLKEAYEKIIKPTNLKVADNKWKNLLTETVISSMAGKRFANYFGKFLEVTDAQKAEDRIENPGLRVEQLNKNSGYLIRLAAQKILSKTAEYLEARKEIDSAYCAYVSMAWIGLLSRKKPIPNVSFS